MTVTTLATLAALGAFHGLNPAMGWLFAVARGLQERSRLALLRALPPIAAGHLASVAIVAALVSATRSVTASTALAVSAVVVLVGLRAVAAALGAALPLGGMRLSAAQLAAWSFLMSSAHGAGLMLLPVLVAEPVPGGHSGHLAAAPVGALSGLAAAGVHTVAMLGVALAVALLVYQVFGVGVLRRAWFNVDRLWAGVLVAAGLVTLIRA